MSPALRTGTASAQGKSAQVGDFYMVPVYDRSQVDLNLLTDKAYFNISDWNRVLHNSRFVRNYVNTVLGTTVVWNHPNYMTRSDIPPVVLLNTLLDNINSIIESSGLAGRTGMLLYADWWMGHTAPSPDYEDANLWEFNLDQVYTMVQRSSTHWIRCGVGTCGQDRTWQRRYRS